MLAALVFGTVLFLAALLSGVARRTMLSTTVLFLIAGFLFSHPPF